MRAGSAKGIQTDPFFVALSLERGCLRLHNGMGRVHIERKNGFPG
jgi:hypothetical protein